MKSKWIDLSLLVAIVAGCSTTAEVPPGLSSSRAKLLESQAMPFSPDGALELNARIGGEEGETTAVEVIIEEGWLVARCCPRAGGWAQPSSKKSAQIEIVVFMWIILLLREPARDADSPR